MAITYPLTMPSAPGIKTISWRNMSNVAVTSSEFTFAQQTQVYDGQLLRADITLPPIKDAATAAQWRAFFHKLNGQQGTFLMGDPDHTAPRGSGGSPVIDTSQAAGSTTIGMRGFADAAGVLLEGDWISLGSGSTTSLHMVLNDVDADGSPSGYALVDIWPRLRRTAADGDLVTLTNPKGLFRLAENVMGWDADEASVYGFSFSCIEAVTV